MVDNQLILAGAIPASVAADFLLGVAERRLTPRGLRIRIALGDRAAVDRPEHRASATAPLPLPSERVRDCGIVSVPFDLTPASRLVWCSPPEGWQPMTSM